MSEMLLPLEQF